MKKTDRRDQLLRIMSTLGKRATRQGDFTVEKIAEVAGGISAAWVYRLVGAEYKDLRSRLEGPRRSPGDTERKLRGEIHKLRRRLKEMEAKYKAEIIGDFSAAVRHIETQDERIRTLEGLVRLLRERLKEPEYTREVMQRGVEPNQESFEEPIDSGGDGKLNDLGDVIDAANN